MYGGWWIADGGWRRRGRGWRKKMKEEPGLMHVARGSTVAIAFLEVALA